MSAGRVSTGRAIRNRAASRLWPDLKSRALAVIILVQVPCAVFFIGDVAADIRALGPGEGWDLHLIAETVASIALIVAILIEAIFLVALIQRQQAAARGMAVAAGALSVVMEEMFDAWGLTAAERDVAAFVIKGLSISEIAEMRSSAEGTVKSQLNAIYRKAGVSGRGQLVSLLIEDLMNTRLVGGVQQHP